MSYNILMQPHSMCAVALANYMWNRHDPTGISSAKMKIDYELRNRPRTNAYRLDYIEENKNSTEIKFYIMRDGGGIACQITISRSSPSEGSKVTMTHSQNHISGLKEEFYLYKNKAISGQHRNSLKYRNFDGESSHPERKKFTLRSEIKRGKDFIPIKYELEITGVS